MPKKHGNGKKHPDGTGRSTEPSQTKSTLEPPPLLARMQQGKKAVVVERKRYKDTVDGHE